jgi:hypothetical protein
MKTITIKTQAEWDALPDSFEEYTEVHIKSGTSFWLSVNWKIGNAHVVARGSSHVEARGRSHVEAWGRSHVVARGSSHVVAWGSSHVEARGRSHVEAWGSSHVEAWERSHVEAAMNASLKIQNSLVIIEKITQQAIAICLEQCTVKEKDDTAQVIVCPRVLYDINSFTNIYKDNLTGKGKMVLYKSVYPTNLCDFYTGEIKYEGTVTCPDFDPNPERECGGGLHLSPTPELALSYNQGKVLKCEVALKDIVVYGRNIDKVRCRKVKVIGEA